MIIVGMSGGVDSSVSAYLLKQQGHDLRGVFMKNWEEEESGLCRAEDDRKDALRVCATLGIPFASRNFAQVYKEQVFEEFLQGYAKGWTPNPDILCNREVKFKVFLEDALSQGADHIATGHYVRREKVGGEWALLRGKDPKKDQSYFLHAISQDALSRSLFPIGHLEKSDVRKYAEQAGLVTARKKDSTGICFIGEQDFKTFLKRFLPAQPGEIVNQKGEVLGMHQGALYYTVGQRAPVGGVKGGSAEPWFVVEKDVQTNRLRVVQGDHDALWATEVITAPMSWVGSIPAGQTFEGEAQIRHLGQPEPASFQVLSNGELLVKFKRPVRAVAIGQSLVVYQGDRCFGGAVMETVVPKAVIDWESKRSKKLTR